VTSYAGANCHGPSSGSRKEKFLGVVVAVDGHHVEGRPTEHLGTVAGAEAEPVGGEEVARVRMAAGQVVVGGGRLRTGSGSGCGYRPVPGRIASS